MFGGQWREWTSPFVEDNDDAFSQSKGEGNPCEDSQSTDYSAVQNIENSGGHDSPDNRMEELYAGERTHGEKQTIAMVSSR